VRLSSLFLYILSILNIFVNSCNVCFTFVPFVINSIDNKQLVLLYIEVKAKKYVASLQGTLAEEEGSVQLTSLYKLV